VQPIFPETTCLIPPRADVPGRGIIQRRCRMTSSNGDRCPRLDSPNIQQSDIFGYDISYMGIN
jgi:hypothetical protein